jgi:Smg protein
MFEVLNYVCNNYWRGQTCPEMAELEHKLNAVGFDTDQVSEALIWLGELTQAASGHGLATTPESASASVLTTAPKATSWRIYTRSEQHRLGAQCLGFIHFLESAGALPLALRELVVERAVAARAAPLPLNDLKMIIKIVYRSLGYQPGPLIMDELGSDHRERVCH